MSKELQDTLFDSPSSAEAASRRAEITPQVAQVATRELITRPSEEAVRPLNALQAEARHKVDDFEGHSMAMENDSQPFGDRSPLPEPSPIVYALSRADEPWKRQMHEANQAGLFLLNPKDFNELRKEDRRVLDRMLLPYLDGIAMSRAGGVLRGHLGGAIYGSSIEKLYRDPIDGSIPPDSELEQYADDLDALREYAIRVGVGLYAAAPLPRIPKKSLLKPADVVFIREGEQLRVLERSKREVA